MPITVPAAPMRWRLAGLGGSTLLAAGGLAAGALPGRDPFAGVPVVAALRGAPGAAMACAYAGLTVLVVAWLHLGRLHLGRPETGRRDLAVTLAWWAAPLALAPPMFSRDVYSYLAQGAMLARGIDPYHFGPSTLGGPLAAEVPEIWQDTPAPYGPVFLTLARAVTTVTGDDVVPGVWGMRLVAIAGVALIAHYLPRLAEATGVDPRTALWLGALNPLVLAHLVAGAHNDAIMLGLLVAGLALVLERRPVPGILAIVLGVLVKAPAAAGLVACIPACAAWWSGRWVKARVAVAVGLGALATAAAVTMLTGTGYGWIRALDTPTVVHNWMSVATDLGHLTGAVAGVLGLDVAAPAMRAWRLAGLVVAAGLAGLAFRHSDRLRPAGVLGAMLLAGVLLGPVVHPWYLLWGLVPLAAAPLAPQVRWCLAGGSAAAAVVLLPHGDPPTMRGYVWAAVGAGLAGFAFAVRRAAADPVLEPVSSVVERRRGGVEDRRRLPL